MVLRFWDYAQIIDIVESFRLMCCTSPELRSASSYGHFTAAKEFWSQCRIFGWYIDISLGESGAHEAPYVALLIGASRPRPGESRGASTIAAPLYIE